ncbi:conserved protein of unknown function [Rhodovastum atsumiense]|nr:conserved protein of unknown function [Rhodovastum atsumiense]
MGYEMIEADREMFERSWRDAQGYHRRAAQFAAEGQRPSLVFNVGSVALERYLVALCALHGAMPFNHNYTALALAAESVVAVPAALVGEIRSLDRIFNICSVDDYHHGEPEPDDARRVLAMCEGVRALFDPAAIEKLRAEVSPARTS